MERSINGVQLRLRGLGQLAVAADERWRRAVLFPTPCWMTNASKSRRHCRFNVMTRGVEEGGVDRHRARWDLAISETPVPDRPIASASRDATQQLRTPTVVLSVG
jgi:hypothetical protein